MLVDSNLFSVVSHAGLDPDSLFSICNHFLHSLVEGNIFLDDLISDSLLETPLSLCGNLVVVDRLARVGTKTL